MQMQRCILSVMAQSYPNAEHIIVRDGPEDELLGEPGASRRTRQGLRVLDRAYRCILLTGMRITEIRNPYEFRLARS